MTLKRREFLTLVGGAAAGYGASLLPLRRLVGLDAPRYESVPARESWVRTCCQLCPGACGMEVRIADGSPVGVRGNVLHPISRGGLCPVGAESMHVLYSPDRIKAPLERAGGARGDAAWKKVTWEAAMDRVATRIKELVAAGKQRQIFLLDGYGRGLLSGIARNFIESIGSGQYFVDRAPSAVEAAMSLSQGIAHEPAYDLENTKTLLSFGVPLLEGWGSPLQGQRAVGSIRGARAEGAMRHLIQFDLRASRTASCADKAVQVKPGSYGAVALSLAYVLIRQNLYDADFVEQQCFGFESWVDARGDKHEGFKDFVLRECRPQDLEPITGVPAPEILEIGRLVAAQRPALAIADGSATAVSNGVPTAFAIHALNALMGSIDRAGGSLVRPVVPMTAWPDVKADNKAVAASESEPIYGRRDAESMLRRMQEVGKVGVLFLLHANPFFSSPAGKRFADVLAEDSLVVSFSPFPDESTAHADVVLPDHTFLERWQDAIGPEAFPNPVLGITRPAARPLFDTRHSGDVLLRLGRATAPDGKKRFPWTTFEEHMRWAAKGLFEARRGSVFTGDREAEEIRQMARRGWWIPHSESFEAFWQEVLGSGGWWDPAYAHELWARVFRTPSGKFELFAQRLYAAVCKKGMSGDEVAKRLSALGLPAHGDSAFMPRHIDVEWQGKTAGGLVLNLFCPVVPNTAVAASLPWVREALNSRVAWETWAELHPEDADRLGLKHGDAVSVESDRGSIEARLLVVPSAQKGVVSVPYGIGRESGGRWARLRGANPNRVLAPVFENIAGIVQRQGTKVMLTRSRGQLHG